MLRREFFFVAAALAARAPSVRPVWTGEGVTALGTPSYDGKLLSCVDPNTRDLAVRDIASGVIRRLTHKPPGSREFAYFSAISPDTRSVACAWNNEEGFYDLRVVPTGGGEARVLYRNAEAGFVQPCAWSPDGKQILTLFFRKDNTSQIAIVSAEDASVRVLKSLAWVYPKRMDFSPDGNFIVYDAFAGTTPGRRDIFLLAVDGTTETRLVDDAADDLFPLWSRDGKHVVFVSDRSGSPALWAAPVSGGKPAGEPFLVRNGLGRILPLGITRDSVLFYALRVGASVVHMESLDESARPVSITGALSPPAWSPNGTSMAYLAPTGSENYGQQARAIRIRVIATGSEREVPAKLAHTERLSWSPDGTRLLVSGSDGKGRAGLFTVAVADGVTRPIVVREGASFRGIEGAWLNNNVVAYAENGVRSIELETGKDEQIYPGLGTVQHLVTGPDMLAFHERQDLIVARDGKVIFRKHAAELSQLAWSGTRLVLLNAGRFQLIDPATAEISDLRIRGYQRGPISANAASIAFVVDETRDEIWATDRLFPEC